MGGLTAGLRPERAALGTDAFLKGDGATERRKPQEVSSGIVAAAQPARPEPASTTLVFTYGPLLSGERNHRLLRTARLVGAASTLPKYELRDLGAFPALVRGGTRAIAGELYEIDAPTLFALDQLEGHPDFYRRARIRLASGTTADAYLLRRDQVQGRPIIESNNWRTRAEEHRHEDRDA
jgi:gamma-glutamylaminecyclotransferase